MKRLPLLFARRYLFARKSHSIINIISGVSAFAVAVPIMAMVVLLSVFNGLEELVRNMYSMFDPEVTISAQRGQVFGIDSVRRMNLEEVGGVEAMSFVLEENVLFEYRGRQYIGVMKGVDSSFREIVPIESLVKEGVYEPYFGDFPQALVGQGIAYSLGIRQGLTSPINIYSPRRGSFGSLVPLDAYNSMRIFPSGVFALDAETDMKYAFVPITFAQELLDRPGQASSVSVKLSPGASPQAVKAAIAGRMGDGFKILTREEQKAEFYRIMGYEKWGIYLIIMLVLVVASFSMIGSLIMLIIEKRADIETIRTLGGDNKLIRGIFMREGLMIYSIGAVAGMAAGIAICAAQQQFGFIGISAETFLIDSYPVRMKLSDMAGIIVSFTVVNYLITYATVGRMLPRNPMAEQSPAKED